VVNLAIHIMNALLLYFFIVLSFKTPCLDKSQIREYSGQVALFGALFFACHPIQTEAVGRGLPPLPRCSICSHSFYI
jgi:hypothetical protein